MDSKRYHGNESGDIADIEAQSRCVRAMRKKSYVADQGVVGDYSRNWIWGAGIGVKGNETRFASDF